MHYFTNLFWCRNLHVSDRSTFHHQESQHCIHSNRYVMLVTWAGWRSRYSDWLRAGRSGDRIPVGTRFSAPVQTGPGAHPASCTMGIGSFQGVKSGRGVTLTPHPLLVPWSWMSRAISLLSLWAVRPVQSLSACTRVQFTLPSTCFGPIYGPSSGGKPHVYNSRCLLFFLDDCMFSWLVGCSIPTRTTVSQPRSFETWFSPHRHGAICLPKVTIMNDQL
jgi:hypothetical protein